MNNIQRFWGWLAMAILMPSCLYGGSNLIKGDSSFETGYGDWTSGNVIDDSTAAHGRGSLKGPSQTQAYYALTPGKPYTFSVYLKAERPQTPIRLRALRSDWSREAAYCDVEAGAEWKRYKLEIPPQTIETYNTVWLFAERLGSNVNFWVDAAQLEEGGMTDYQPAEAVSRSCEVVAPVPGNIYYPEEDVKLRFQLFNNQNTEENCILAYDLKDCYEEPIKTEKMEFKLAPRTNWSREVDLGRLDKKGFYVVSFSVADNERAYKRQKVSFCVVAHPLPFNKDEGSLFALSSIPEARIPAAGRMGCKFTKLPIRWTNISPEKGKLNEGEVMCLGKIMDRLLAHQINPVGRFERTPAWAGEYAGEKALIKEEALTAYEDFVYQIISRYRDKTSLWLHWDGEDDLTSKCDMAKTGKPEDWVMDRRAAIMKAGYRGAKKADPDCCYGGLGCPSGVDCSAHFPYTRRMFVRAKDAADWLGLDCYTWPRTFFTRARVQSPEELGLTNILNEALAIIGAKKRCWITEYGFAMDTAEEVDSPLGKKLAAYMARSFILVATVPRIERVDWFSCWDCVEGGATYDMWRWPNPMPVVAAYSALAQVLTGAQHPREVAMGACLKGYVFEKKEGSVAFLWSPDRDKVKVEFAGNDRMTVVDIMGNVVAQSPAALDASGTPLYLLSSLPADKLSQSLALAKINVTPLEVELRLNDSRTMTAYVINQLNTNLDGTMELSFPVMGKGKQMVTGDIRQARPGVIETVKLTLPGTLDIMGLAAGPGTGKVMTGKGVAQISEKLPLMECHKLNRKIIVDGNLGEWAGMPFIEVKDLKYLEPPDAFGHKLWTAEADLSLRGYVGWDEEKFYFAAEVADDVHVNLADKKNIWSGDSVQMAFDPENNALTHEHAGYKDDDREYSMGYSRTLKRSVIIQDWPLPPVEAAVEAVVKRDENKKKTCYEAAIPWKQLGMTGKVGKIFGFNFVALDADSKSVDYWMGLTPGIGGGKDPAQFLRFILVNGEVP